mmetsp:Transcript_112073/g.282118  ORF Transcript_112073/g.282118 Transcript_112073/m.282118 type:complete len:529 (+) Transcript_112073:122-1708(+)
MLGSAPATTSALAIVAWAAYVVGAAESGSCSTSRGAGTPCTLADLVDAGSEETSLLQQSWQVNGHTPSHVSVAAFGTAHLPVNKKDDGSMTEALVHSMQGHRRSDQSAARDHAESRVEEALGRLQGQHLSVLPPKRKSSESVGHSLSMRALNFALGDEDVVDLGSVSNVQQTLILYALLFFPIIAAKVSLGFGGQVDKGYRISLTCMYCAFSVTYNVANQTLAFWMGAPNAIAAIQSFLTFILLGTWAAWTRGESLRFDKQFCYMLVTWLPASAAYAAYQLSSHLVSYACSLSERVVFMNLTPAITLLIEIVIMPLHLRTKASYKVCISLGAMVVGAVLYSLQYTNFTAAGFLSACMMICTAIPYRILQRLLLIACPDLPVPLLTSVDGLVLFAPSLIIAEAQDPNLWQSVATWLTSPRIVTMLLLSFVSFAGVHIVGLAFLKDAPATSFQVLYNMANFLLVLISALLFQDRLFDLPLVVIGISVSLSGSLAYSLVAGSAGEDGKEEDSEASSATASAKEKSATVKGS